MHSAAQRNEIVAVGKHRVEQYGLQEGAVNSGVTQAVR